jgi:hypothetical protein
LDSKRWDARPIWISFDIGDRLKRLGDLRDQLEAFWRQWISSCSPETEGGVGYPDESEGGRLTIEPAKNLDPRHSGNEQLSDEHAEFLSNDPLSFMRWLRLGLADRVPDARTIWLFREKRPKPAPLRRCLNISTRC